MKSTHPDTLLKQECTEACKRLEQLDIENLARRSGFLRRKVRKISLSDFVRALLSVAADSFLSLGVIAEAVCLSSGKSYSKQALSKRLSSSVERFLAEVTSAVFGQLPHAEQLRKGPLSHFRRVLVQDSTVKNLPAALAKDFPGSSNQRSKFASMRVQYTTDILSSEMAHLSLSSFRRNDVKAACDILEVVREGDLVLRDLGYFLVRAFQGIQDLGAFFLSRMRVDATVYDLAGNELDLEAELRRVDQIDREVLIGPQRLRVRLVAQPVPEEVKNLRRRNAKNNRDHRFQSSKRRLFLMGWNLLVTNVPRAVWPSRVLLPVYRLRWRIELIFKTWKSYLGFRNIKCTSPDLLRLYTMTKLLYFALTYRFAQALELICKPGGAKPSLLRVARIIAMYAAVYKSSILGVSPEHLFRNTLDRDAYYEKREDRPTFASNLAAIQLE